MMPITKIARVDESSCIGCTKCIAVCPTDAIIGCENHMHTVIEALCIGCELCLPACPVDCITWVMPSDHHRRLSKKEIIERTRSREHRLASKAKKLVPLSQSNDAKKQYLSQVIKRIIK